MKHSWRRRVAVIMIGALGLVLLGGWTSSATATLVTGPPPGTSAWLEDTTLSTELPHPSSSPAYINRFFASLTESEKRYLLDTHPSVVGNMDGAPLQLRYAANAAVSGQGDRQLLAWDARGRGLFVEVYGDLATAEHIAVIVPGVGADSSTHTGVTRAARNLYDELTDNSAKPVATIAWLGYTTPIGIDAAMNTSAASGAPRLDRFLEGLKSLRGNKPLPTLICHSYGTVLCGQSHSDAASNMVLVSSPGTSKSHVSQMPTKAKVWSVQRNSDDWIKYVPNVKIVGLGHGRAPSSPEFGAPILSSAGSEGHPGYFEAGSESLENFSAVTREAAEETRCINGRCAQ